MRFNTLICFFDLISFQVSAHVLCFDHARQQTDEADVSQVMRESGPDICLDGAIKESSDFDLPMFCNHHFDGFVHL